MPYPKAPKAMKSTTFLLRYANEITFISSFEKANINYKVHTSFFKTIAY